MIFKKCFGRFFINIFKFFLEDDICRKFQSDPCFEGFCIRRDEEGHKNRLKPYPDKSTKNNLKPSQDL